MEKQLKCCCLQALQESGCLRGKARPLSIAASLMMGFFTSTQSVSYRSEENGIQWRRVHRGQHFTARTRESPYPICTGIHRAVVLQQPVVISPVYRNNNNKKIITAKQRSALMCRRQRACVPDDVIEDDEPLKLQLELTVGVFRQRLSFKPAEPEICILVSINKQLERTNLDRAMHENILLDTG